MGLPSLHLPRTFLADFIKAQWRVSDSEYFTPAMEWCKKIGCSLALTKAQLYDAMIQVSADSASTACGWPQRCLPMA